MSEINELRRRVAELEDKRRNDEFGRSLALLVGGTVLLVAIARRRNT